MSRHFDAPTDPAERSRQPSSAIQDLSRLLDVIPTGVLLLDTLGNVLRLNAAAAARIGQSEMDVLGVGFFTDVFPQLEAQGVGRQYRDGMARGSVAIEWTGTLPTPSGDRRLRLVVRALELGAVLWGLAVLEELSAPGLGGTRRGRAQRMAAIGELATAVGREVEGLLGTPGTTDAAPRELVALSEVAERALDAHRGALERAGIEVRRDLDAGLSEVAGDPEALQRVVLGLLAYAERALAHQPDPRLLIVRTRESSEGVVLSVVDNGPGIPREELPRLFDASLPVARGGSVPSLGACAAIVRDHGGQMMAESEEGQGAAVFVRLPRATAAVDAPPEAAPPGETVPETRRLRVLVADDEPTLRLAISLFLSRRGHLVTQAADAYEALRLAQEDEFDVALVDARMPGDGVALLEKLEGMPTLRGRTALMTGDLGRAGLRGVATTRPHLVKPFDMVEAVTLIEQLGG